MEQLFHQPNAPNTPQAMIIIAVIIILLGIVLFAVERLARHLKGLNGISMKDAIVIGLSQSLAIFPGVSRSGSTITGGLASGLKREDAARFSFLLGAPMIAGAGLKSVYEIFSSLIARTMVQSELLLFGVGFIAAAISGFFCIKFLLRFLQKYSTDVFVYYRWLLAALIIVVVFVRK